MPELWRRSLGSYRGRLMRCAPGTHEAAADVIVQHVNKNSRVLDLASGTGALLARLRDLGFTDLHAVELNFEGFAVDGVTPMPLDLNGNFASALPKDFALVAAIEIIEHLDNPRHFLGQIRQVLQEGGHLLLTTPNIAHWLGRTRFLLKGELRQFQRHDYDYQRHITPISDIQMRLIFEELGFELVEATTAGTFFGPLKQVVFAPVALACRAVMGPRSNGDVSIYLARKTTARSSSAGRDSLYFKTTGA